MTSDQDPALVRLDETDLTLANAADDLRGRKAVDVNGDEIGEIDGLTMDLQERRLRFIHVGSGEFLGIGEKKVLIPVDAITHVDSDSVRIDKTREHVAEAPLYDRAVDVRPGSAGESHAGITFGPEYYNSLYRHFGHLPYWTTGYAYPNFARTEPPHH